jgi:hypothetical protein
MLFRENRCFIILVAVSLFATRDVLVLTGTD